MDNHYNAIYCPVRSECSSWMVVYLNSPPVCHTHYSITRLLKGNFAVLKTSLSWAARKACWLHVQLHYKDRFKASTFVATIANDLNFTEFAMAVTNSGGYEKRFWSTREEAKNWYVVLLWLPLYSDPHQALQFFFHISKQLTVLDLDRCILRFCWLCFSLWLSPQFGTCT